MVEANIVPPPLLYSYLYICWESEGGSPLEQKSWISCKLGINGINSRFVSLPPVPSCLGYYIKIIAHA